MSDDKKAPALQNIPLRTELGRELRKAFALDYAKRVGVLPVDYAALEKRIAETNAANVQHLPRTEWQCVVCARVNEKATGACSDCGSSYELTRMVDRETHG